MDTSLRTSIHEIAFLKKSWQVSLFQRNPLLPELRHEHKQATTSAYIESGTTAPRIRNLGTK
jgi:hypothetical protein